MWSWGLNGPLFFSKLQAVTSLPECASFSPLSHFNKNKLLVKGVDSSHCLASKASHASSTAISFTAPSAAFYVPHPHHIANPTLFSSSFLFPPHISPCHFNILLLAPFRPLPPTPGSPAAAAVGQGRMPPTHMHRDCWPWWLDLAAAMINASTRQEASTSTCQTNIYLLKHIIPAWGHTLWWTNPDLGPHLAILLALIFPQLILHSPGKEPLFDFW